MTALNNFPDFLTIPVSVAVDGKAANAVELRKEAISKIDKETRELLQDTFDKVNMHFSELFPILFGGGNAKHLNPADLPHKARIVANTAGIIGGVRPWDLDARIDVAALPLSDAAKSLAKSDGKPALEQAIRKYNRSRDEDSIEVA